MVAPQLDVWLVPTSDREAFGFSKIEGMRYGLPVIVLGGGGSGEYLTSGRDALVNSKRDPFCSDWNLDPGALARCVDHVSLAEQIRQLYRDDQFRIELAYNALETARRLDPAKPLRDIEVTYREMVA